MTTRLYCNRNSPVNYLIWYMYLYMNAILRKLTCINEIQQTLFRALSMWMSSADDRSTLYILCSKNVEIQIFIFIQIQQVKCILNK